MMNNWLTTLQAQGADLTQDNRLRHTHKGSIVPLLDYRTLTVIGPDSEKFLQGQLSCNMQDVKQQGSSLGSHCSVKGQMISLFRINCTNNGFMLRVHQDLQQLTAETLRKYSIFSKVEIAQKTNLVGIGLLGKNVQKLARLALPNTNLPTIENAVVQTQDRTLIAVPNNRYELWLMAEDAQNLLPELLKIDQLGNDNIWLLEEIRAGIPDLRSTTHSTFLPQMINLQAIGGVSFTKGCYTGQEIIARTQHRGLLKRPMYRFSVESEQPPVPADPVFNSSNVKVGQVLLAAEYQTGAYELLAVVAKEQVEQKPLYLENGGQLTLTELPYQLDEALFEVKTHRL